MLGGFYEGSKRSRSVLTSSLAALLQCFQSKSGSLGAQMKTSLTRGLQVWHQLADTPVTLSMQMCLTAWTTAGSRWERFTYKRCSCHSHVQYDNLLMGGHQSHGNSSISMSSGSFPSQRTHGSGWLCT